MSTIVHRRPPRKPGPTAPKGEITLQEPPELPEPTKRNLSGGLMMLPMGLGMAAGGLVMFAGGGGAGSSLTPGLMGVSMLGMALMGVFRGGGDRKRKLNSDRRDYMRYLSQERRKVRKAAEMQRAAQRWHHPPPDQLGELVPTDRLWERRATDDDFAHTRLAIGSQRLSLRLTPPQTRPVEDLEPLSVVSLRRFIQAHHSVEGVPISLSLPSFSTVLIRGHGAPVDALARAIICQLATMHSPRDLQIVACVARERRKNWEWLKWLPHMHHPKNNDAAGPVRMFAEQLPDIEQLLGADQFTERPRFKPKSPPPKGQPFVVVLLDGVRVPPNSRFTGVGFAGAVTIDVGATLSPRARNHTMELNIEDDELFVISAEEDTPPKSIGAPDGLSLDIARNLARSISRYRPAAAGADATAEPLDASVELPDLLGIPDVSAFDPHTYWSDRASWQELLVPIGMKDDGTPIELDIKEAAQGGSGPHGMLIGATGSGKSELLRTLVMSLACTHSSATLNFVLVDFKGGATFLGLGKLPHTSAIITNLADEISMVDRMEDAIQGEMVRRQELLRSHGQPSLRSYERARLNGADLEPLPSLVLIIDEFSELLAAKREFVNLFVMVGRLGRSLGVHLLLASQRLDEGRMGELSSHLSYRIGLKTFSASESRAVLGITDAYEKPLPPGGGFIKTDNETIERFKAAYISAPIQATPVRPSRDDSQAVATGVSRFALAYIPPAVSPEVTAETTPEPEEDTENEHPDPERPSLMSVLAARLEGSGPPAHRVWLPPLSTPPCLNDLTPGLDPTDGPLPSSDKPPFGRLVAPIGYIDKPIEQRWDYLFANLSGSGGHVGIGGGPRSGKSTALCTLIMSLAVTHKPSQVGFYCLDLGGGGLTPLTGLPHVGTIASRLQKERVQRTVHELTKLLNDRETFFSNNGIDSINDYRQRRANGEFAEGRYSDDVFLVIDGWFTIKEDFEQLESSIQTLVSRGLSFGIHLIVATSRWANARPWLRDGLGTKFELRMGDPIDSAINSRAAATVPAVPGRGLTTSKEHFLTGLPRIDGSSETEDLADALRASVDRIAKSWPDEKVQEIETVPKILTLDRLPPAEGTAEQSSNLVVPLGLGTEDLQPISHNFGTDPHLIVIGDNESGKTNLLKVIAQAVVDRMPPESAQILLADYRRQLYAAIPDDYRLAYASSGSQLKDMITETASALKQRVPGPDISPQRLPSRDWWSGKKLFVLIDDYDLVSGGFDSPLAPILDLLPAGGDIGLHLVIARAAAGASRGMNDAVVRRLNELGTPTMLFSCPREEGMFGSVRAERLAVGRAKYVTRRNVPTLQTVLLEPEGSLSSPTSSDSSLAATPAGAG